VRGPLTSGSGAVGPDPGLCGHCRNARVVESRKGSRFYFCLKSKTDPAFPRYPPLPVLECRGYEPTREAPHARGRPDPDKENKET
jgi:hypothetical protein